MMIGLITQKSIGAQANQRGLKLRTDMECIIAIDGKVGGMLEPDHEVVVPLAPGKHRVIAVSSSGDDIWEGTLDFNGSDDLHVAVALLQA